ncbi:MAG: CvpA family protein [Pirellulaceae bacterium]
MQAYDLFMLIVLAMAMIFGAIKGFAWQVASIASVIVSYLVAYNFRFEVANMIQATPPWNQFLAMLILYVGTSFAIWVGFRLFSGMIDRVKLKEFDRHLGAGFGLAKGALYCLLITMFAMSLLGKNQQRAIGQSRSGYFIAHALERGIGILPKEVHDVVGPYLVRLDNQLEEGQQGPPATVTDWQDPSIQGSGLGELIQNQLPAGQLTDAVSGALQNLPFTGGNPGGGSIDPRGNTNATTTNPNSYVYPNQTTPLGSQRFDGILPPGTSQNYTPPATGGYPAATYPANRLRSADQSQQPNYSGPR